MAIVVLATTTPEASAVERLRAMLDDTSIDLVYRRSATGTWIDAFGEQIAQSDLDADRAFTPLERDGDWLAALIHPSWPLDQQTAIEVACADVVSAIDVERRAAELQAQLRDEQASRARILAASDRQRRRFERNLHDGAQQRLVGLSLAIGLAARRAASDGDVAELLVDASRELDDAMADLRELARGLHPAIVSDAGLRSAIEMLAERPGIPVELRIDLPERLSDVVEVAAYYLVAESLTNSNKHSGADAITVTAQVVDDQLEITVSDNGYGGATTSGSGILGLADRLGALGGQLVVESTPDSGTTITGYIPLRVRSATTHPIVDDILLRVVPNDVAPPDEEAPRSGEAIRGDLDRRLRAIKWMAWRDHAAPGEIIEAQPEFVDLQYAKALLLFVGGNTKITERRRDWIIGFLTAAGYSENVLNAAAAYEDSDTFAEVMSLPGMDIVQRVLLHDALMACALDTLRLTPDAFDPVLRAAAATGIPRDVVADLHEIVVEEAQLRMRRHEIVVAPALPKLVNDSIKATRAASRPQE
ncbi:MAG TPA: histidine kinase [Mycobacteriales bacterium]|jgi:signal transduction histidine kinase|nr:histidine kinase [Mycobacteriales bacterium]